MAILNLKKVLSLLIAFSFFTGLLIGNQASYGANPNCISPATYPPNIATCLEIVPGIATPEKKPAQSFTLIPGNTSADKAVVTIGGVTKTASFQTSIDKINGKYLITLNVEDGFKIQLLGQYMNDRLVSSPTEYLTLTLQGMVPNSIFTLWLLSNPNLLENVTASKDGDAFSRIKIPDGVSIGEHHLQIAAKLENNTKINISIPFLVTKKPVVLKKNRIYFQLQSSTLSSRQKTLLANIVKEISKVRDENQSITIQVVGYTQYSKEKLSLASERANTVAKALKLLGITQKLLISGNGNAPEKANLARYVQINITARKIR